MNNRNFLFLSLFSYLVTISCSAMETREIIVPLNRDDFKKFTTSALEITEELHALLNNKTAENIKGLTERLIATTKNIQNTLTKAGIYEQDPIRAKLAVSPEQKITKPVLTDYEVAILEIRLILLHPNSNEPTTNTPISIDTLTTYQENAQNYVTNNPNLDETQRNDFELYIKDTQKLIALRKKSQSKDNIVDTPEQNIEDKAETEKLEKEKKETPEAKTQRITQEIIQAKNVILLPPTKCDYYLRNIIILANVIADLNNNLILDLQASELFLQMSHDYFVRTALLHGLINLNEKTEFTVAWNTIKNHKQQKQKPQINIVTGLTGLTFIVILAILYKYNKLSIIMEKISNLVSSRVSSGA